MNHSQRHAMEKPAAIYTGPLELKPGVNCDKFAFIGSQVIPGAATETSDTDIAVLLVEGSDPNEIFTEIMKAARLGLDSGNDCMISDGEGYTSIDGDGMTSCKIWRGDEIWNYLVFTDDDYFWKFIDATTIAKRFGIVGKPLRVKLFALLCDGYRHRDGHFEHVEVHQETIKPEDGAPF